MTTGEDQPELVVTHGSVPVHIVARIVRRVCNRTKLFMKLTAPGRPTKVINSTVTRGGNDPPRRVGWDTVVSPAIACHNKRLLHCILGKSDIAEDSDQRRHRLAVCFTKHTLDFCRILMGSDARSQSLRSLACRKTG